MHRTHYRTPLVSKNVTFFRPVGTLYVSLLKLAIYREFHMVSNFNELNITFSQVDVYKRQNQDTSNNTIDIIQYYGDQKAVVKATLLSEILDITFSVYFNKEATSSHFGTPRMQSVRQQ